MNDPTLSRRSFLKGSGSVLMGTLLFASGPIAALVPSKSWALPLTTLDEHQSRTLLVFTRHLFPHKNMDDAVYALVVKDLDKASSTDPAVRKLLLDGLASLDKASQGDWLKLSPAAQLTEVKAMEGSPFFAKVRSTAVVSLYSNDMAYAYFGYGAAQGDGGYLYRGFNDLHWLPDPPVPDASGPMPPS